MQGYKWDLNPYIQKTLYTTVAEKVITYGAAVWSAPMQGRKVKHLLSIQRLFLLNVTKAFRTSPTNALCVLAGLLPLHLSVEKEAAYQEITQLGNLTTFRDELYSPAEFEQKMIRLADHPSTQGQGVKISIKQNTNVKEDDLVYYTDGSKLDENTGCAYVALRQQSTIAQWKGHLDTNNSVFQSEVMAIKQALLTIIQQRQRDSFIITDSLSSLYAIVNPVHSSPLIAEIQTHLRDHSHLNTRIEWTKAHVGNRGNEQADQLAKEAARNINAEHITIPWPVSYLKKSLKHKAKSVWQEEWDTGETGRRAHYHVPTVDSDRLIVHAQMVRYITGHGPFPVYYEKHGIAQNAHCICGEMGTPDHYVTQCPLTADLHLPIPTTNTQAFCRFMVKDKRTVRKINKIVDKLMNVGTDLCLI
ncbi:uncharacterized protein LOC118204638 [Stegodyphus dumicola]|uniref:uncharacterized protein LOC118204638 n=1 Tax=Stegodyphus dumicola TaxID=202533 RepID=UPI0015B0F8CA|nr:uncharacterized protein LOC118204638 [Stegodyphus dumicola]